MKKARLYFLVILFLCLFSCSGKFLGQYTVGNYGNYGLLIHKIGPIDFMEKYNKPSKDHPGIPGVRDDHVIGGFGKTFPTGQQEIVWQLAKLSECEHVMDVLSIVPDFPGVYTRKADNCKWTPLPKVYKQTIDFDDIINSPEYQAAKKFRWNIFDNSQYGVRILFAFKDDEIEMHLKYFKTNPWQ